jgi:hypothetical protein
MRRRRPSDPDKPTSGGAYDRYNQLAHVFGFMVVVGLLLEVVIGAIWFHGWETGFSIAAVILIALGVWGEIHFGNKARIAGDALLAAYEARTAEANERAVQAQLELERIKQPRQWDTAKVAAKISQYSGTVAAIAVSLEEPEQWHVADLMYETLRRAGWKVADWWPGITQERWHRGDGERLVLVGTKSGLSGGIMITPAFGDEAGEAPAMLANALRGEGIVVHAFPIHTNVHKNVMISIGSKS